MPSLASGPLPLPQPQRMMKMWRFSIVRTQREKWRLWGMFLSVQLMDVFLFLFVFLCSWKFNRSRVPEDLMKWWNGCGCEGESRSFTSVAVRRLTQPSSRVSRLINGPSRLCCSPISWRYAHRHTHTHTHITDNQVRESKTLEASQAAEAPRCLRGS